MNLKQVSGLSVIVIIGLGSAGFHYDRISLFKKNVFKEPPKTVKENIFIPIKEDYQDYLDYFEKVFQTMQESYYQLVSQDAFDSFVEKFRTKIYAQLKGEGKSINYVRWRSASMLVEALRAKEDSISGLFPPKPAKEFEQTSLGIRMDLGIEGELTDEGFKVSHVEPRSEAYEKGLRIQDVIFKIDDVLAKTKTNEEIRQLLNPLVDTKVNLEYLTASSKEIRKIEVTPKEFFRQSVFHKPTPIPGVVCLEIRRFNQKTSEDLLRYLDFFKTKNALKGLILDLRGNPGGPPLAAREISSFFLPAREEFAYFQKRGHPKSTLDIPAIPEKFHYSGPMIILINKESGSSSELFTGVLQKRGRAIVMGTNSAGQVLLKSMFPFEDESMLLLVTGRGYHPDGSAFSFNGITPDFLIDDKAGVDVIEFATRYLVSKNLQSWKR